MNDHQILPVEAALLYTADFTDMLPTGVDLGACVWSSTPSLTLNGQADDFANAQSTIKASGSAHGVTYLLQAKGTGSNGETYTKDIALRGWNG